MQPKPEHTTETELIQLIYFLCCMLHAAGQWSIFFFFSGIHFPFKWENLEIVEMHFKFWLCWRQLFNILFHYVIAFRKQTALNWHYVFASHIYIFFVGWKLSFTVLIFIFHMDI